MNLKRFMQKPFAKTILMISFLLLAAAVSALAWLSRKEITESPEYAASIIYDMEIDSESEFTFFVNDDGFLPPPPGYISPEGYLGVDTDTAGIYLESLDDPMKLRIINRSNREAYVRIKVIPEWQQQISSTVIAPLIANDVNLGYLFGNGLNITPLSAGATPAPGSDKETVFIRAVDQLSTLSVGLGANSVYDDNGVDTLTKAYFIYLLDGSNLAVVKPPNLDSGDSFETRFEIDLDEGRLARYLPIPIDAHSLKLTFQVEAIQGTNRMLEYAQNPANHGITVPWGYNPIPLGSPTPPPTRTPTPLLSP